MCSFIEPQIGHGPTYEICMILFETYLTIKLLTRGIRLISIVIPDH